MNVFAVEQLKTTMSTQDTPKDETKPSAFLRLPRELRDLIYRELLVAKNNPDLEDSVYGLEPSILAVNKQVHLETKEVLYRENTWVIFSTNEQRFAEIFFKATPFMKITSSDLYSFGGDPEWRNFAIRVVLKESDSDLTVTEFAHTVIMKKEDVCAIWSCIWPILNVNIELEIGGGAGTFDYVFGDLLDDLKDIINLDYIHVTGPAAEFYLKGLDMFLDAHSDTTGSRISDRLETYTERAAEAVLAKNYGEAVRAYRRGILYSTSMLDYAAKDQEYRHAFYQKHWELKIWFARCYFLLGENEQALSMLSSGKDKTYHEVPPSTKANACRLRGMLHRVDGLYCRAIEETLKVLFWQPGNDSAISQLKDLEPMVDTLVIPSRCERIRMLLELCQPLKDETPNTPSLYREIAEIWLFSNQ